MEKQLRTSFELMQAAFLEARAVILAGPSESAHKLKLDNSPVTEVDVAVEHMIIEFMRKNGSAVPVLGEESGYNSEQLPSPCWLIDPIDGTKSYIQNVPGYTCMAVLILDGKALASIIYNPQTGTLYTAIRGEGAFRNGTSVTLLNTVMPKQIFSKPDLIEPIIQILKYEDIAVELAPSGAGYGFMQVIDGNAAARIHIHAGSHLHDHAPGALIIQEAGGLIIPVFEDEYSLKTKSFIACHPDFRTTAFSHLAEIRAIEKPSQAL